MMAIVVPLFTGPDIMRTFHYIKKKMIAKKVKKVCMFCTCRFSGCVMLIRNVFLCRRRSSASNLSLFTSVLGPHELSALPVHNPRDALNLLVLSSYCYSATPTDIDIRSLVNLFTSIHSFLLHNLHGLSLAIVCHIY